MVPRLNPGFSSGTPWRNHLGMKIARVIPCLDVNDGRVVKGVNFVGLRDAGDPVELAERYVAEGADELVLLDITATTENRETFVDVVRRVAERVSIPFAIGGGIRNVADARRVLDAGVDKVSVNSAAVERPEVISELSAEYGAQCVVSAIDARRCVDDGVRCESGFEVLTRGGLNATGLDAVAWARKVEELGAGEILLTSLDRDGTKDGYDIEMTRAVSDAVSIPVIASGGVGNLDHMVAGIVDGGAAAVLAASIFHFGQYSIAEAKQFLADRGVEVTPIG